jgi:NADP-reducing hydrogenase subunit HndD
MDNVNIKINGQELSVPRNFTVLQAARHANIDIPTLCYLKDVSQTGSCRMCVCEVSNARALQAACLYPVSEGLEIKTNTKRVRDSRRATLELILSAHDRKCLTCVRNRNCELQKLSEELGITEIPFEGAHNGHEVDNLSPSIVRDNNKCILCRRCVNACKNIQSVAVIEAANRGFDTKITCAFDKSLSEVACVNCGQCIAVCPVGALYEKNNIEDVWTAINDPDKYVIVQTAPAVRAALGEEFGFPMGTPVTGKMAAALRRMGFDNVFDTNTAADLTIMEEGTELLERIKNGGVLPMITSCSPGWIKFCEHYYPEFIPNLSSCKSPHEMYGALLKSYYAEKMNIDPAKMVVVSVMPCTAKKFEAQREELGTKYPDVDYVLTTRELATMIKQSGLNFAALPDEGFDSPFDVDTGAGVIFGATGGVMEAALRTVAETLNGKPLDKLDFEDVRGIQGIKEASLNLGGMDVKVAIASGLGNARKLLDKIKAGEANYHFIEVMACPGGCVNGGGQPIVSAKDRMEKDIRLERAKALYEEDKKATVRQSHRNADIEKLYKEYFGKPGSQKAHKLLHTHYVERAKY